MTEEFEIERMQLPAALRIADQLLAAQPAPWPSGALDVSPVTQITANPGDQDYFSGNQFEGGKCVLYELDIPQNATPRKFSGSQR